MEDSVDTYASLNDVPPDVEAVADSDGTIISRGPDRPDWWWLPWDEYVGDPMTPDELDSFGPFSISKRFSASKID